MPPVPPTRKISRQLKEHADYVRPVRPSMLSASQLPDRFPGTTIARQLAHPERNAVSAADNFADEHLPVPRKIMQRGADYLYLVKAGAFVVPLFKSP